jgi:hypothetical protein
MGKFEDNEKNEQFQEKETQEKSESVSGFDLLNEDQAALGDIEAKVYKPESTEAEMFRTSVFGRADSQLHAEAAQVGKLFTPENRAAIVANIPS